MATYFRDPDAPTHFEGDDSPWADLAGLRVAESARQHSILQVVSSSLMELIELRGWTDNVQVGGHTFFAWKPGDPTARVAPDLYLVDGPEPDLQIWEAWNPNFRSPRWVLEVVSSYWRKDYYGSPNKYAHLGTSEMVIFDPLLVSGHSAGRPSPRKPLTLYRRWDDGQLHAVYSGNGPAYSPELNVWLAATVENDRPRLRLWLDEEGKQVVPTEREANERSKRRADEQKRRADEEAAERERVARQRDQEKLRADEERAARERMAERMRRAGLDPDDDS